jgi:hypothetical protein
VTIALQRPAIIAMLHRLWNGRGVTECILVKETSITKGIVNHIKQLNQTDERFIDLMLPPMESEEELTFS